MIISKKSQAAMEFLMTYGWALLVVIIAIAALAFFGLLNPWRFLPERVELPAGFIVQGAAWNEDDSAFDIFVHNGIGQRVTDFQLEIQGCDLSNSVSISPGNTERITVPCNTITPNARFNSDIRVNYKTITDGHTLDRTGIGRISMDVGVVGDILVCNDNLEFHAGIGNEENPYQICNWFHLNNTRTYLSAHYVLVSNLGPSTPGYDGLGDDWEPIGASFIGTFDGMGNLISDLVIELGTNYYGGLFRSIGESGEVRNIGLVDVDIKADMRVGGIAGHSSGIISNSFTTGLVSGFSEGSEEAAQVGGLTGTNTGIINNSYSKADVEGIWGIGGLDGEGGATIINSYFAGGITAAWGVGEAGGIIGVDFSGDANIINTYWNTETSGINHMCGTDGEPCDNTKGRTTLQMTTVPRGDVYVGWDFEDVWTQNNGQYPRLAWE